ncbi:MAG TPA: carboxypeptidase regulatory-like domain-containing protein [bacterium]|nr:carboxypeptidase regulatory-like domain-containing protein [bacterium]
MTLKKWSLMVLLIGVALMMVLPARAADTKGRLFVTIHDSQKKPLEGVKITLTSTVSAEKEYVIETDEKGKAMIVGLDPDMYNVKAEKEGYQFIEGPVKLRPGVNVKHEWTLKTIEEAKQEAIDKKLQEMTEEERNHVFSEEAHNAGVEAFQAGDMDTAKEKFAEAIKLDENIHYFDYLILGQLAFNQKDVETAQKYLMKAKELDTGNEAIGDIGAILGATYMVQEDYARAREIWAEQVEIQPDPTVLYNLASIEIRSDKIEDALKWLKMSYEKFPDEPSNMNAIRLLGDVYIQMNNYPKH